MSNSEINDNNKIINKLVELCHCTICRDYMYVPIIITPCGHNYCYECITSWFNNVSTVLTCPQCRSQVEHLPGLNLALQQLLNLLIDSKRDSKLLKLKDELVAQYKSDLVRDNLFNGVFKKSAVAVIDADDEGILRCSNCHWEIEEEDGSICPHCNSRLRATDISNTANNNNNNNSDYSDGELEELEEEIYRHRREADNQLHRALSEDNAQRSDTVNSSITNVNIATGGGGYDDDDDDDDDDDGDDDDGDNNNNNINKRWNISDEHVHGINYGIEDIGTGTDSQNEEEEHDSELDGFIVSDNESLEEQQEEEQEEEVEDISSTTENMNVNIASDSYSDSDFDNEEAIEQIATNSGATRKRKRATIVLDDEE